MSIIIGVSCACSGATRDDARDHVAGLCRVFECSVCIWIGYRSCVDEGLIQTIIAIVEIPYRGRCINAESRRIVIGVSQVEHGASQVIVVNVEAGHGIHIIF